VLAILTYHSLDTSGSILSVAPQRFAEQMAHLARLGFQGMSLRAAVAYRHTHGTWPERGVVLTFDDGYANCYEAALPVLRQHGFTATVFLVNGHVGGYNDWEPPLALLGTQPMLTWGQVAALAQAGLEIGAHTVTHRDLQRLTTAEIEGEISACRDDIARRLGTQVESFAYPFGSTSPLVCELVQRAFRTACTTILKRAETEPLHRLPRIDMYYIRSLSMLERLLTGHLDRYLAMRRWGRVVRRGLVASAY
jgi:peptidoglycan/xylan/chitin deacetylase (PgdA/CDA1 family)